MRCGRSSRVRRAVARGACRRWLREPTLTKCEPAVWDRLLCVTCSSNQSVADSGGLIARTGESRCCVQSGAFDRGLLARAGRWLPLWLAAGSGQGTDRLRWRGAGRQRFERREAERPVPVANVAAVVRKRSRASPVPSPVSTVSVRHVGRHRMTTFGLRRRGPFARRDRLAVLESGPRPHQTVAASGLGGS